MRSAIARYVVRPAPVANASTTSASPYTVRIRSKIVRTVSGWLPIRPCTSLLLLCRQSEPEDEEHGVVGDPRVESGEVAHAGEPVRDRVDVDVLASGGLRHGSRREVV